MVNKNIVSYLEEGKRRGFGTKLLKQKLLEGGFNSKDIDIALREMKKRLSHKNKNGTKKPKKKIKQKRTVSNKESSLRRSVLSGAIRDLEVEIKNLEKERISLQKTLKNISSVIDVDHEKEKELQKKIGELIGQEATLNHKKKNLEAKIDRISDEINKISKIKSEMSDV